MEIDLLESREDVDRLAPAIRNFAKETLRADDITSSPEYYLPRISNAQRPRVVVCYEEGQLVGVVYAEELKICGIPTGFVFGGDEMGRGLVLAEPDREAKVLATACDYLLNRGVHGLRLTWRSNGRERMPVLALSSDRLQMWCKSEERPEGDWLQLEPTYEAFLHRLGTHTRRNLRYYRRKAEEQGFRYLADLSVDDYEKNLEALNRVADYPSLRDRDLRDRRFFNQFGAPMLVGLAAPDGRLVSMLSAIRSGTHLHVLTQLNDESKDLRRLSISLVLRAYLIEQVITQDFTAIHFVNGVSAMLGRFCDPVRMHNIAIDSRRSLLHLNKLALARLAKSWQRRGHRIPMRLRILLGSYLAD